MQPDRHPGLFLELEKVYCRMDDDGRTDAVRRADEPVARGVLYAFLKHMMVMR